MGQDQENIKHPKRGRWDGKEIDRDQLFGVVVEERPPGLRRSRTPMFGAILADGRIRDLNAQFGQFGLDPWTAPGGIGLPHPTNQRDELAVDGGSSLAGTGFPAPEKAKAKPMPSDNGLGLEEEQGVLPARPAAQ